MNTNFIFIFIFINLIVYNFLHMIFNVKNETALEIKFLNNPQNCNFNFFFLIINEFQNSTQFLK